MTYPILYSFRRCPYAMRARLALAFAGQGYELREVNLKNKPAAMLEASPKGTVPVLVFPTDKKILEESLDIVNWAINHTLQPSFAVLDSDLTKQSNKLIDQFMLNFVLALNRYKYPDRFNIERHEDLDKPLYSFLEQLENRFKDTGCDFLFADKPSGADICLFPLIRQMRIVDHERFDKHLPKRVLKWFWYFNDHSLFEKIMQKVEPWSPENAGEKKPCIVSFYP